MYCSIVLKLKESNEFLKYDNISEKLHIRDLIHIFGGYLDEIWGADFLIWGT